MSTQMHVQPYWGKPGPKAIPRISDMRTARQWLKACDGNGWTPLIEESFHGRVNNVLSLLRLAKSAYDDEGLREYVRTKDNLGIDACGWARLHSHKNWQMIDLLTRYGGY
ncbi:MAG: hypothetical protein PHV13_04265 [Candidatus ainarchaeum sp.]|nr:hypothetical protein [Candidatus ainarchaeum sp.]